MRRRIFVGILTGCIVVAPRAGMAQPVGMVPRVVFISVNPNDSFGPGYKTLVDAFRAGLKDLGYVDGRNVKVEFRDGGGKPEQVPGVLAALVQQKIDVLFASSPDNVLAAMHATRTIPIVFATIIDPVGAGLVASLARPGGNVTGVAWDATPQIAAKQFQLLREMVPGNRSMAVVWNPDVIGSAAFFKETQHAAESANVALRSVEVRAPAQFDSAYANISAAGIKTLVVLGSDFTWLYRKELVALAARYRMPAIYGNRDSAEAGGLLSYGASLRDQMFLAASYVAKILKGAKPADLPVEQPTKFELVINMKTAKALGITIPQSLLLRADEVIQ